MTMSEQYPNAATTRWVLYNLDHGGTVILDDGSKWQVEPTKRETARCWPKTTHLTVEALGGEYVLKADDDESVYALYRGFDSYWTNGAKGRA